MCIQPDLAQKKQILINALDFMSALGYERPAVAALCAIEKLNPDMPETVHACELKRLVSEGVIPGCSFEGPISYDLAMSPEAAHLKSFDCPLAGDFDVLLVPNLVAGNLLGKCMVYTMKGKMAGLILGAQAPIVLTSRSASAEEKYNSIAIAAGVKTGDKNP
jgi:phosphate butyryltransferase